jgi:protein TonB
MHRNIIFVLAVSCVLLSGCGAGGNETATERSSNPSPDASALSDTTDPPEFSPVEKAAVPTKQVTPEYPEELKQARVEGVVWVKMVVGANGMVRKAVVQKSDVESLNKYAIAAAMRWEFTPAMVNGKPISVWVATPFKFSLSK